MVLKNWQLETIRLLAEQTDREVLFVVDYIGNEGKTYLAKWLINEMNAFYANTTVYTDIMYAYNDEPVVIFDIAREPCQLCTWG